MANRSRYIGEAGGCGATQSNYLPQSGGPGAGPGAAGAGGAGGYDGGAGPGGASGYGGGAGPGGGVGPGGASGYGGGNNADLGGSLDVPSAGGGMGRGRGMMRGRGMARGGMGRGGFGRGGGGVGGGVGGGGGSAEGFEPDAAGGAPGGAQVIVHHHMMITPQMRQQQILRQRKEQALELQNLQLQQRQQQELAQLAIQQQQVQQRQKLQQLQLQQRSNTLQMVEKQRSQNAHFGGLIMATHKLSFFEKIANTLGVLYRHQARQYPRRLEILKAVYKHELAPPKSSDLPIVKAHSAQIQKYVQAKQYQSLTVKEALVYGAVALEVVFWFFVGEMIGRRYIFGYLVPADFVSKETKKEAKKAACSIIYNL
ncbi:unnamed protein product [Caenorhabditis auriculariae]|uniref:Uncharacterized protein n=1 Tax=Caenorhabditis auriculariae TaxID=2777116 RepID=A0A8S1GWE9_9PELO|nr:unnamed protein product [Caenorhabditis auriculariae]